MTPLVVDVAVRALLIASGTASVLWALRIRTAAVRHAAWTAVVIAMLLLPIWSIGGPKMALAVLPTTGETTGIVTPVTQPLRNPPAGSVVSTPQAAPTAPTSSVAPMVASSLSWPVVLLGLYLLGVFVLLLRLSIGTVHAHRLRRSAVMHDGRATSVRCATPITVGWFSPMLILPDGWERWPAAQLAAVITHEQAHARRHDPLVQWLSLFNRAVFWFHPLAWWLERRLATLAEEACDAAVLHAGHSPQDYSEYLLDMARSVTRVGRRINVVGMAMPGSGLPQRIRHIYEGVPMMPISRARVVCTIVFCALSSVIFAAGTVVRQSQVVPAPPADLKFEVVSIKPCGEATPRAGRGIPPDAAQISPGYVHWDCVTLYALIEQAYAGNSNPLLNNINPRQQGSPKLVRGGPDWAQSEKYMIEGKGPVITNGINGPILNLPTQTRLLIRTMLEDRFQLKLRRVREERPLYALSVGTGGLKLGPAAPSKCWQRSATQTTPPPGYEGLLACGYNARGGTERGNQVTTFTGVSMTQLSEHLSILMDRNVMDKTGVDGRFDFTITFAPDDHTPSVAEQRARSQAAAASMGVAANLNPNPRPVPDGPTIFKALELVGLKLESAKGPQEFLQIDSVQRPKPNSPAVAADAAMAGKPAAVAVSAATASRR